MSHREPRPRPRRRARHRALSGAEGLEARRLLVATPIQVAAGLSFAIASPLPGLASTAGPATSVQSLSSVSASVAPTTQAAPPTMFGPTATGPATTLSPLANDSETAVAAASEVARPQPGRSDRISVEVEETEIPAEPPTLEVGEPVEVVPGPEFQAPAAIQANPVEAPPAPAPPEATPTPAPEPAPLPEAIEPAASLDAWDRALDLVTPSDRSDDADATPTVATRLAAGVVAVVAWGGYRYAPRAGRSRQDAQVVTGGEAGPGRPGKARR